MAAKSGKKKSNEELLAGFNALRAEQRQIANKIYELESEHQEHKIVIEALKETEPERKCFRMIGGILVEGTVKEVLPNLIDNASRMNDILDTMNKQLIQKGKEILEYKEKNPGCFVTGREGVPEKILEEEEEESSSTDKLSAKSTGILTGGKT